MRVELTHRQFWMQDPVATRDGWVARRINQLLENPDAAPEPETQAAPSAAASTSTASAPAPSGGDVDMSE